LAPKRSETARITRSPGTRSGGLLGWDHEAALGGKKANSSQLAGGAGDRVLLGEVLGIEGEGQFVDRRPGRVLVEQEPEHGTFRSSVIRSGIFSATARRVFGSHEED
jgi:hypothetical protein